MNISIYGILERFSDRIETKVKNVNDSEGTHFDLNNARYGLRSASSYCIQVPCIKSKKTLGDRSFTLSAAQLWNSLLFAVKSANRLIIFKSKLKSHFFKKAFVSSINF